MPPRVLAAALLAQALGGLTSVWTKLALDGLGPWTLVFARQLLGLPFLLALAQISRREPRRRARWSARDVGMLLLLSWAGFALPQVLLAHGIERSTAVSSSLLTPLEPIGIVLGSALWLSEGLPRARVIALLLGTLGASMIVVQDGLSPEFGDAFGDALIAIGHLSWAIYTLAAKPLLERHDEGRVSLLGVALTLPPLALLASGESLDPARALPALVWVLLLAALSTAACTWLWNWALHRMRAGTMGVLIFVQPVVGVAAGTLGLGERTGALALLGTLAILAGVTLEVRRRG